MNRNQLASRIAKIEGKKHQASIGDIREILKDLVMLQATHMFKGRTPRNEPVTIILKDAHNLFWAMSVKPSKKKKMKAHK